jgi:hypothetical protein
MPYVSYLILAAQRLAIDPNAMLMYYENNGIVYATTPDGVQHTFTYADLNRPSANAVAKTAQKGPGSPSAGAQLVNPETKKVANSTPSLIGPPIKRKRK